LFPSMKSAYRIWCRNKSFLKALFSNFNHFWYTIKYLQNMPEEELEELKIDMLVNYLKNTR
jgi:hypothetical protein